MGTEPQGTRFHRSLGLVWSFSGDLVVVRLELRPDLCGPAGALEGGIVSTLIDVAGASVAAAETGLLVVTQQMSISFLAPGEVGPIAAAARILRRGRRDVVSEVRVTDEGQSDRLVAAGLATFKTIGELPDRGALLGDDAHRRTTTSSNMSRRGDRPDSAPE